MSDQSSNDKNCHSAIRWTVITLVVLAIILVPFVLLGKQIDAWTDAALKEAQGQHLIVSLTLGGLLASDILLPVPSSIASTACGLLLGIPLGTVVSWVGMIISCIIGYALAARLGHPFVNRMVGERSMEHFERLRSRYGYWIIILSRPIPVLAEASVLFAGLGKMPIRGFLLLTTLSNLGISLAYATIGALSANLNAFLPAFCGAVLLPGLGMLWARARTQL
jgi:uncharacterized membrane protein YdjX (TVP38/TMEM64 family)